MIITGLCVRRGDRHVEREIRLSAALEGLDSLPVLFERHPQPLEVALATLPAAISAQRGSIP